MVDVTRRKNVWSRIAAALTILLAVVMYLVWPESAEDGVLSGLRNLAVTREDSPGPGDYIDERLIFRAGDPRVPQFEKAHEMELPKPSLSMFDSGDRICYAWFERDYSSVTLRLNRTGLERVAHWFNTLWHS